MNSAHGTFGRYGRFDNEVIKRAEIVVESEEEKSLLDQYFRTKTLEDVEDERTKLISIVVGVISD